MMEPELGSVPRDARMLVLFDEIYRTRSMTRAAERLNLSQPTASIWLSKLRREWRDPLFVRTTSGMQPTPRADALIGPAREALALLRRLSAALPGFDPVATQRTFRIGMTDASHITLLPRLLAHVRAIGRDIRLDVVPISAGIGNSLETGQADLAVGNIPGLEAGFHEQRLYTQDFVCLVNAKHPRIGDMLTQHCVQGGGAHRNPFLHELPDPAELVQAAMGSNGVCNSSCRGFWASPQSSPRPT